MTSNTNQLKPYVVVEPITASDATVVGSLSEAPETIPGPSTFHHGLGSLSAFECASFTIGYELSPLTVPCIQMAGWAGPSLRNPLIIMEVGVQGCHEAGTVYLPRLGLCTANTCSANAL